MQHNFTATSPLPLIQVTYYKNTSHDTQFQLCVHMVAAHNNVNILVFTDNATTVYCELYIRSFGSISPVTMVSLLQSFRTFRVKNDKYTPKIQHDNSDFEIRNFFSKRCYFCFDLFNSFEFDSRWLQYLITHYQLKRINKRQMTIQLLVFNSYLLLHNRNSGEI